MSKKRTIDTRFWADTIIRSLKPLHRYLYIYLLTNDHNNIAGVYEIAEDMILFESGLNKKDYQEGMKILSKDGKVAYVDGWIFLKNFAKYQNNQSPKVQAGIKRELEQVPKPILDTISVSYANGSIYFNSYLYSYLDLDSNLDSTKEECDDLLEFFNKTCGTELRLTNNKKKQVKARLQTFSLEEIKRAISERVKIPWYAGENKEGKLWYKDWDSLFRNDEKIDKILNENTKPKITHKIMNERGRTFEMTEEEIEKLRAEGRIKYDDKGEYFI